uniref:Uncharacterized protein n=1 Tax=Plectus sambesii TaxID=2011161 RepID=A0A914UWW2_9BILA
MSQWAKLNSAIDAETLASGPQTRPSRTGSEGERGSRVQFSLIRRDRLAPTQYTTAGVFPARDRHRRLLPAISAGKARLNMRTNCRRSCSWSANASHRTPVAKRPHFLLLLLRTA